MGGFPLQLLHSLVFLIKDYITLVLSLLIKLCLILFTVSDPSCHASYGTPLLLPFIMFREVAFSLCPSLFMRQDSLLCRTTPWIHQYGLLHQLTLLYIVTSGILVGCSSSLLLRVLIYPYSCLIIFCIFTMAASLVATRLEYSATWVIRFIFVTMMLVTSALSSAVACTRFAKSSSIMTRSLAP